MRIGVFITHRLRFHYYWTRQAVMTVRTHILKGEGQFTTFRTTHNIICNINAATGTSLGVVAYLMTTFWTLYNSHNLLFS